MNKTRVIYNVEGLFIGPSPASGYHFITPEGALTNDYNGDNFNLIKNLTRVQSVTYNINALYTDINTIGKHTPIKRLASEPPTVSVEFSYLQFGVINELRMGFYTNYARNYDPYNGAPIFADNYSICVLSGFITRDADYFVEGYGWPYPTRDKRNLFVAVNNTNTDLNSQTATEFDINSPNMGVFGFGNCYITQYQATAAINEFPICRATYIADNMSYYSSGSGCSIPAVDEETRIPFEDRYFTIPSMLQYDSDNPSVLLPGDITLDFTVVSGLQGINAVSPFTGIADTTSSSDLANLGISFTDIHLQRYSLNIDLTRNNINKFGYKLALDKVLNFPVQVTCDIDILMSNSQTGSLLNIVNNNDDYNLTIKLANPDDKGDIPGATAVRYDLKRAKFVGASYSNIIGSNKVATLNFVTHIDPRDLTKGLFISGQTNIDLDLESSITSGALTDGTGDAITDGAGNAIVGTLYGLFY